MRPRIRILGVPFFTGTVGEAVAEALQGGLVLAPSGPGMGHDLRRADYCAALAAADLNLPDSGAMVLFWNLRNLLRPSRCLGRLSGLRFLQAFLADARVPARRTFWVMPNAAERDANLDWLRRQGFPALTAEDTYLAPKYQPGAIADPALLASLENLRPEIVFVNLGGGIQEPLGAWLKQNLSFRPTIICTGAAIAFLSGLQTPIPRWADALYFGWLLRVLSAPPRFLPRYLRAARLLPLILRYGANAP